MPLTVKECLSTILRSLFLSLELSGQIFCQVLFSLQIKSECLHFCNIGYFYIFHRRCQEQ